MVHVSAPGRLMIAGEWAVLEPGNPCIVAAVDKRFHSELVENQSIEINFEDMGSVFSGSFDGKAFSLNPPMDEENPEHVGFIKDAVETALKYVKSKGKELKTFSLRLWSGTNPLDADRIIFGFYASYTVSVVSGILKFHGFDIESEKSKSIIYKLSVLAHYSSRERAGSAYKVASAVYGGVIMYRRFEDEWLRLELEDLKNGKQSLADVAEKNWPGFYVKKLRVPEDMFLLAGFAGDPHSSYSKVSQMKNFRNHDRAEYDKFMLKIKNAVETLVANIESGNIEQILKMLRTNRDILEELGKKSGVEIETPAMRRLSWIADKHHGAGKISGAGRGNCGMAICFTKSCIEGIKNEWARNGVVPINVSIENEGIKTEV